MEERNEIERQTVAALSHLQGVVLYILDPSEHCGYLIDSQLSLASDLKKWLTLPVLVVANKADILKFGEDQDMLNMSTETGQGVNEVLEKLVSLLDAMPRYVAPDPDQNEEPMVPSRRT
jgi:nucleolar GTP-binding protein